MNEPAPAPAARPPLGLFEILAIVLLWNCAYKGGRVANTLYLLDLGADSLHTGLMLATYSVFPLLLAVFTGKIADRYGARIPVMVGTSVSLAGLLLPWLWPSVPVLFVSAAVCGFGFILAQVSIQSLVGSLGTGASRTHNLNMYALLVSTSDFLGPILAGFSIDHYGNERTFLHLAVPSALAVVAVAFLARRLPHNAGGAEGRDDQRMADLLRIPDLRRMFITSALVMGGLDLFQLYLPIYAHSIGLSASAIGLILGSFAAAGFVTRAGLPLVVKRYGEEPSLRYAMFLAASTFFLIPQFQEAVVLGAVCFVLGLGIGMGQPLTVILTYNYSPPKRHGEGLGLRIAINNSMHVTVPALFGAVGSLIGLAPIFWVSSAILVAGGWTARAGRAAP